MSGAYGRREGDISAPALLRLGFEGGIEELPRIPFHQLTHLHLDLNMYSTRPPVFLAVLSRCPALVELRALCYLDASLVPTYSSIPPPEDHECIVLHNLAAFSMSYPLVSWLLARLTLPALKTLQVERTFWSSSIYHSFQSRSSFSLKSIVLIHLRNMNYFDFFDLLRDTPSIREIISCGTLFPTPTLIAGLASDSHQGFSILAPNLEYLGICQITFPDNGFIVHDQVVLDMISSRDPSGQRAVCVESRSLGTKIFKSHSTREPSLAGEVPPFAMKQHLCEDMPKNKTVHHFFF